MKFGDFMLSFRQGGVRRDKHILFSDTGNNNIRFDYTMNDHEENGGRSARVAGGKAGMPQVRTDAISTSVADVASLSISRVALFAAASLVDVMLPAQHDPFLTGEERSRNDAFVPRRARSATPCLIVASHR